MDTFGATLLHKIYLVDTIFPPKKRLLSIVIKFVLKNVLIKNNKYYVALLLVKKHILYAPFEGVYMQLLSDSLMHLYISEM